jgi:hypothetical protein
MNAFGCLGIAAFVVADRRAVLSFFATAFQLETSR